MGFKIFRETFCVQIVSEDFSIEAFKYQKYTKFISNCLETICNFCCVGHKILKQKRL